MCLDNYEAAFYITLRPLRLQGLLESLLQGQRCHQFCSLANIMRREYIIAHVCCCTHTHVKIIYQHMQFLYNQEAARHVIHFTVKPKTLLTMLRNYCGTHFAERVFPRLHTQA